MALVPGAEDPSAVLPKIQKLRMAQLLFALQRLHPTNKAGLQPFGLVLLVTFWHRPAYLALHAIP